MSAHAAAAAARTVAGITPIDLATLNERAALQQRVDTKFIVYPSVLQAFTDRLGDELQVLEIGGRRQFGYLSTYFDSPDLRTYRDHVQQRRRRFKVRTRTYVESALCTFEVKLEGARGETDKHRIEHPLDRATELTTTAKTMLDDLLVSNGIRTEEHLAAATSTGYQRITLTGANRPFRVTVDTALECVGQRGSMRALQDRLLLEVKTAHERDPIISLLHEFGVRPTSVSKYCVGVAMLHPELPRTPWVSTIRRHFANAELDLAAERIAA